MLIPNYVLHIEDDTRRLDQARSQVLRFRGAKYIFKQARFLFLLYFLNKFFWEQ